MAEMRNVAVSKRPVKQQKTKGKFKQSLPLQFKNKLLIDFFLLLSLLKAIS